MKKKLTIMILVSLVLGLVVGIVVNSYFPQYYKHFDYYLFNPLGTIFINLIKMVVVPLVFFSIVVGVIGLGSPKKLGRIGLRTIALYFFTTAIAVTIALVLANVIQPGDNVQIQSGVEKPELDKPPALMTSLLSMIPSNPIQSMVEANMMQVIVFALSVGVAAFLLRDKVKVFCDFCEQANEVMIKIVFLVMYLAPFGAFGLMASAVGKAGVELIGSMALYMCTILFALFLHMTLIYGSLLWFLGKTNPIQFYKSLMPAMETAFATSSSAATLPVTMDCVENKLRVDRGVSSFVLPLGATMNMDGTAIMQGVAAIFIGQIYGIDLSITEQLIIILTATLASIGTAAVPSAGMVMLTIVLTSVGLPVEGIAIVLGVDRLLDMARTMTNITGDATVAVVVDRSERNVQSAEKESSGAA